MKKKTTFKRVLAGLMGAAVLASSLFSANVFAADDSTAASVQAEKQIVSGHQTVDQYFPGDGDNRVHITKSVAPTGVENEFEVTVEVETTETITEITNSPDAAVVLVLDVSNSMSGTDLTNAKTAAKNFIDDYVKDAGEAKRMLSIVQFGSNALTVMDWTDVNGAAASAKSVINDDVKIKFSYSSNGCSYNGCTSTDKTHTHSVWSQTADWTKTKDNSYGQKDEYTCTVCGVKDFAYSRQGCSAHQHEKSFWESHNVTDSGGTNIEGGLRIANNLLADSAVSGIETTYVIMMTDGLPTFYVADKDTTTSTVFMKGSEGCKNAPNGNCNKPNDYTDVPDVVDSIQETAKMYVVGCGLSGTVNYVNVKTWLTSASYVGVDQYFDAANSGQLAQYFKNIAEIIKNAAKAWIMEDPMGESIDFVKGVSVNMEGTTATESDGNITWNLKDDATFTTTTVDNVTTYTYTMTYKVKLDTASAAFKEAAKETGEAIVPTNGDITLTYMVTDENGDLDPELKTATFKKSPMVKGYLGEKVEFKKIDSRTKDALAGAEFTLFRVENGKEVVVDTATSDAEGKVAFTDIPSGFTYTITETKAPANYIGTDEEYSFTVSYGDIINESGNLLNELNEAANTPVSHTVRYVFVGSDHPEDENDILPTDDKAYYAGDSVTLAKAPETEDTTAKWVFDGWYVDRDCTEKAADPYTMGTEDVTFYGKWSKTELYTVKYEFVTDAPAGAVAPEEKSYEKGTLVEIDETAYEFKDWQFLGWYTEYNADKKTKAEDFNIYKDTVIYGVWTKTTGILEVKLPYDTEYWFADANGNYTLGEYVVDKNATGYAETVREYAFEDEIVEAKVVDFDNYTFNSTKSADTISGKVVRPEAVLDESGAVTGVTILTLKLYYDPIPDIPLDPIKAAYITEYYFETEDGVYEINEDETERDFASVGDIVDAEIKEFEGYVHNAEWDESILSGEVVMPSMSETQELEILTLKVYYDIAESVAHGGFKVVKGDGEYEVSETFMFELYGVVDGEKTEVPVAVSRVNVSKVFEQERGFDIWFFNVPLAGYDSFILQEVTGESEDWTYDTTEYAVYLVETEAGYALMTEDGSYVNILNTYTAPEEPTPPPSEPEEPTIIRIVKTWVGGEYDGEVTFIVTDAETDREYVETLDEGDRYVDVEVRRGGTYYVEEVEIDGWETSFTDRKGNPERNGDVVTVDDGETAKVYVTNTLIEEEIPEEEPPMVEEPSEEPPVEEIPDEEPPIVAPPKTGSAAGSAAALFACAALLGAVVLRKKK